MRCLYICVCDRLPGLSQPTVYCYLYYPPSSHRVRRCICHPIFHNNCPLVLIPPPFCPQGKKLHLPPRSFKTKFSLLLVLPPFWPLGKKLHPPPDLSQPTALCYLYYPFGFTRDRVNPQLHLPPDLSQPTAHWYLTYPPVVYRIRSCTCHPIFHNRLPTCTLAFTRYWPDQYWMVYGSPKRGRRGVVHCAIAVQ